MIAAPSPSLFSLPPFVTSFTPFAPSLPAFDTLFPEQEAFLMQARILGTTMPVLEVDLNPNESVFSESGELSWMTASIQMTTHTQMGGGGGFSACSSARLPAPASS